MAERFTTTPSTIAGAGGALSTEHLDVPAANIGRDRGNIFSNSTWAKPVTSREVMPVKPVGSVTSTTCITQQVYSKLDQPKTWPSIGFSPTTHGAKRPAQTTDNVHDALGLINSALLDFPSSGTTYPNPITQSSLTTRDSKSWMQHSTGVHFPARDIDFGLQLQVETHSPSTENSTAIPSPHGNTNTMNSPLMNQTAESSLAHQRGVHLASVAQLVSNNRATTIPQISPCGINTGAHSPASDTHLSASPHSLEKHSPASASHSPASDVNVTSLSPASDGNTLYSPSSDKNVGIHSLIGDRTVGTYPLVGDRDPVGDTNVGIHSPVGDENVNMHSPGVDRNVGIQSPIGDTNVSIHLPVGDRNVGIHSPVGDINVGIHSPVGDRNVGIHSPVGDTNVGIHSPVGDRNVRIHSSVDRNVDIHSSVVDRNVTMHSPNNNSYVTSTDSPGKTDVFSLGLPMANRTPASRSSTPILSVPTVTVSSFSSTTTTQNLSVPTTGIVAVKRIPSPVHVSDHTAPGPSPSQPSSTAGVPSKPTQRVIPIQRTETIVIDDDLETGPSSTLTSTSPRSLLVTSGMSTLPGVCKGKGLTPEEKANRCVLCFRYFADKQDLQRHLKSHAGDKPFKCSVCMKSFTHDCFLQSHLRVHTGETPFKCTFCDKAFKQKGNLKTHMQIHYTGTKPFQCEICGKRFTLKGSLKTHTEVIHRPRDQVFDCNLCDKTFTLKGSWKTHLANHERKEKHFQCTFCEKKFSTKGNLKTHIATHSGDKPFLCTLCGKSFTQNGNLRTHMMKKHEDVVTLAKLS